MSASPVRLVIPWHEKVRLRTILTEPRQHELLFESGKVLKLTAADFLSVASFQAKFLDAIGSFPEFPDKFPGRFLKEVAARWFANREEVEADEEASDGGMLRADIRTFLRSAPESDDGLDLEHGAVISRRPSGLLFLPRIALDRVRRVCPIKLTPAAFYAALEALGCTSEGVVRIGLWRGRVWHVPLRALDAAPELTA